MSLHRMPSNWTHNSVVSEEQIRADLSRTDKVSMMALLISQSFKVDLLKYFLYYVTQKRKKLFQPFE